jgi:hypothetical protein
MLKGGYALELWMKAARSTVDIDLTMPSTANTNSSNDMVREMLQTAASQQLGDWLEYLVGSPMLDLDAAPYGGARYPIEARMDARIFARFHLDVGIGDVVLFPLEELTGRNWLEFAGIERLRVRSISREQHFAEKLHAYTLPRSTPNSRAKDLVDMVLLIQSNSLDPARTAEAIRLTFERRSTHAIPSQLDAPPHDWNRQFGVLAKECGLSLDIEGAFDILKSFVMTIAALRL